MSSLLQIPKFSYNCSFIISGGFSSDFIDAVWNVHVPCLKQECVSGSVMLPNKKPLRDQYVFVSVKFLCVRFSVFS